MHIALLLLYTTLTALSSHASMLSSTRNTNMEALIREPSEERATLLLSANKHILPSTSTENHPSLETFQSHLAMLLTEEAVLARYVTHWEWFPAFSRRFLACQNVRQALNKQLSTQSWAPSEVAMLHLPDVAGPSTTWALPPTVYATLSTVSIGAYFFAHYLTSHEALSIFTYNFQRLSDEQRTELYAEMRQHCATKKRRGDEDFVYMEIKVCKDIALLENLLRQMQISKLPLLLAKKQSMILERMHHPEQDEDFEPLDGESRDPDDVSTFHASTSSHPVHVDGTLLRFSCCFKINGCFATTTVNSIMPETKETVEEERWRKLRQAIAAETLTLSRAMESQVALAARFREAFTNNHIAIVQRAMEWKKEACSDEKILLKRKGGSFL